MPAELSDDQLTARAVAGDAAALERLLLKDYARLAEHVAHRLPTSLKHVIGVEDILQDTFTQAFRDVARFEPRTAGSIHSWLCTIADHRLLDAVKRLRRLKRGGGRAEFRAAPIGDDGALTAVAGLLCDHGQTPSELVARREAVARLRVAIAGLPAEYMTAVRLKVIEGRSLEETAAEMGRTPAAVHGLLDRAKKELRAAMGRSSLYFAAK